MVTDKRTWESLELSLPQRVRIRANFEIMVEESGGGMVLEHGIMIPPNILLLKFFI